MRRRIVASGNPGCSSRESRDSLALTMTTESPTGSNLDEFMRLGSDSTPEKPIRAGAQVVRHNTDDRKVELYEAKCRGMIGDE
jgi:hypothetical protein